MLRPYLLRPPNPTLERRSSIENDPRRNAKEREVLYPNSRIFAWLRGFLTDVLAYVLLRHGRCVDAELARPGERVEGDRAIAEVAVRHAKVQRRLPIDR